MNFCSHCRKHTWACDLQQHNDVTLRWFKEDKLLSPWWNWEMNRAHEMTSSGCLTQHQPTVRNLIFVKSAVKGLHFVITQRPWTCHQSAGVQKASVIEGQELQKLCLGFRAERRQTCPQTGGGGRGSAWSWFLSRWSLLVSDWCWYYYYSEAEENPLNKSWNMSKPLCGVVAFDELDHRRTIIHLMD